jgi:hypothetical protein
MFETSFVSESESGLIPTVKEFIQDHGIVGSLGVVGLFLLACAACAACLGLACGWGATEPESATRVLTQSGYHNVHITGYRWFACGEGDYYATGFWASSPSGELVTGTVCEGWLKAKTIRLD